MQAEPFDYEKLKQFRALPFRVPHSAPLNVRLMHFTPASLERRWVPYYHFHILMHDNPIGHVNFRVGNTQDLLEIDGHIGYFVDPNYRGISAAFQACNLIIPFIKNHGFTTLVLTCNPSNIASQKTIEKLGAEFQSIKHFPKTLPDGDKARAIYHLSLAT